MQLMSASYIDGQFLPVSQDSFYHARRILDAVATGSVFQFDPLMHVPEGDWVTWPWAYDWALARVVWLVTQVKSSSAPIAILVHLPPLLGVLAVGLVVGICAQLRMQLSLTVVAASCFALHALTAFQFGVGSVDHHGAEQIATLGSLLLGLRWLNKPDQAGRALLLGLWLGVVLGIHTGLFMLQLPLVATFFLLWVRRMSVPALSARWLATGIMTGTLAVLLPASTFWSARFVVYYLSSMQLYVAACTCVVALYMSHWPFSRRNLLVFTALCVALVLPLLSALLFSKGFLSGDLSVIGGIDEIHSVFFIADRPDGIQRINQLYTLLIWTAPIAWLASLVMILRDREAAATYFWVACVFGLTLLPLQLRLASFGVFYLYLPLLVVTSRVLLKRPRMTPILLPGVIAMLVLAYYPTIRHQIFGPDLPAADMEFATLQPLIPVLRDACATEPGIVLAQPGDGHLVRYFTNCAVISNNFRLTPLDVAKVRESLDLIEMPIDRMRATAPQVKYVIARLVAPVESPNPILFEELLDSTGKRPEYIRSPNSV
jgi:hypothetical protein